MVEQQLRAMKAHDGPGQPHLGPLAPSARGPGAVTSGALGPALVLDEFGLPGGFLVPLWTCVFGSELPEGRSLLAELFWHRSCSALLAQTWRGCAPRGCGCCPGRCRRCFRLWLSVVEKLLLLVPGGQRCWVCPWGAPSATRCWARWRRVLALSPATSSAAGQELFSSQRRCPWTWPLGSGVPELLDS